ncbi:hypothetical protein DFJ74DRAFT_261968 [Hyaloraphidium curvatum]|nr:hypothetical protein DFJ74DRAFT_261968 [Hyaloraphidium curvatum]
MGTRVKLFLAPFRGVLRSCSGFWGSSTKTFAAKWISGSRPSTVRRIFRSSSALLLAPLRSIPARTGLAAAPSPCFTRSKPIAGFRCVLNPADWRGGCLTKWETRPNLAQGIGERWPASVVRGNHPSAGGLPSECPTASPPSRKVRWCSWPSLLSNKRRIAMLETTDGLDLAEARFGRVLRKRSKRPAGQSRGH